MNLDNRFTFYNFLVDEGNKLAFTASKQVVEQLGLFNPFFIYGKNGYGKTHLLHAIGNEFIKNKKNVLYVTAGKLIEDFEATNESNYEKFQNKYYSADVLMIDDIQLLKSKEKLENELLNILNIQNFSDKQLIFASDRCIDDLDFKSVFISKLHSGLEVNIFEPTLSLKKEFIQKIVKEYNIELTDEMIEYIALNNCEMKSIQDCMNQLLIYIKEKNCEVNLDIVKNILKGFIKDDIHELRASIDYKENILGIIKTEVANYYHIPIEYMNLRIKGSANKKNVTNARYLAIYLAKELMTIDTLIVANSFKRYNKTTFHFIADSFGIYDTDRNSAGALVSHLWADFDAHHFEFEINKLKPICEKKIKEEIKKIIQSVDIVDIIKNYIPLEKRGKNYFGICPFHKDDKSTLSVSPEKQIYKCFCCGASGNVITFVKDYEQMKLNEKLEKFFGGE